MGLPAHITACLFDLDGVITKTAIQHAQAWKQVFEANGIPFDEVKDYDDYVDGKPREEGVRSLLEARHLPQDADLIAKIAADKDRLFLALIKKEGVETYPSSVEYVEKAKQKGLRVAVVSSSRHTTDVLKAAGLQELFDAQMDGIVAAREHLQGKPAPDTYLKAAEMLHTEPSNAAVYEDALAGVEAGRNGHFGIVIGVDRAHQREALKQHGAGVVVDDLSELLQA